MHANDVFVVASATACCRPYDGQTQWLVAMHSCQPEQGSNTPFHESNGCIWGPRGHPLSLIIVACIKDPKVRQGSSFRVAVSWRPTSVVLLHPLLSCHPLSLAISLAQYPLAPHLSVQPRPIVWGLAWSRLLLGACCGSGLLRSAASWAGAMRSKVMAWRFGGVK